MISFSLAMKTANPLNGSRGFSRAAAMASARAARKQHHDAYLAALGALGQPRARWRVTLTRVSSGTMDDDGLRAALKHVRDGIAYAIGADDGRGLIAWEYSQRKGPPGAQSVEVAVVEVRT